MRLSGSPSIRASINGFYCLIRKTTLPLWIIGAEGRPVKIITTVCHREASMRMIRIAVAIALGLIAESMRVQLNRALIVESRPGAAGRLGIQSVKDAPADGTVLLFTPIAPMV